MSADADETWATTHLLHVPCRREQLARLVGVLGEQVPANE